MLDFTLVQQILYRLYVHPTSAQILFSLMLYNGRQQVIKLSGISKENLTLYGIVHISEYTKQSPPSHRNISWSQGLLRVIPYKDEKSDRLHDAK